MHESEASARSGLQAVRAMFDTRLCRMRYDLGDDRAPWSVAYFGGVQLQGIDVYRDDGIDRRRVVRDRIDISESPADEFLLAMPFSAGIEMLQSGRPVRCQPGEAVLFSTSQPFSSVISASQRGARYSQFLSRISGSLLRQRIPNLDALANVVFDVRVGAGSVVKSLLELALHESSSLTASQSASFSAMLIDAIANVASEASTARPRAATNSNVAQARLRQRAEDYVHRQLHDPQLDVASIAAHCGISERYLHAAFASSSLRPGAYIREARLQRCRSELRNPAARHRSIIEIAVGWGFTDAAHFSRLYKARFGRCPRTERFADTADAAQNPSPN